VASTSSLLGAPRLRGYPHPCEQTFTLLQRSPPSRDPTTSLARERVGADTEERRSAAAYLGARGAPYAGLDGCYRAPSGGRGTWRLVYPSHHSVRDCQPPGIVLCLALYGLRSHIRVNDLIIRADSKVVSVSLSARHLPPATPPIS